MLNLILSGICLVIFASDWFNGKEHPAYLAFVWCLYAIVLQWVEFKEKYANTN